MKRWIPRLVAALGVLAVLVTQAAPASAGTWLNHNETLVDDRS